jgi:signal transduction histidine kinase
LNKQAASSRRLDWITFGLRWLLIASGLIALAADGTFAASNVPQQALVIGIIAAVVYNLLFALLLLFGLSGGALELVTMVGDAMLTTLFFWASGGSPLIMVGMGLFATIVATLRYGRTQGLLITALIGVLCFAVDAAMGQTVAHGPLLLSGILFLFLTAALTCLVSRSAGKDPLGDAARIEQEIESNRLRAARERAQAIYEMASTLSATLDYNKVLDAALDVGVLGLKDMGPETRLMGMVLLFQNDELRVVTSRRLTRQDEKLAVPGRRGVLGLALKQAEPVFASTAADDPELKYCAAFQDARSILAIPLRAGFDNYGVLVFGATQPNAFSDEHIELLTAIGTQATIALQNAVLYQNLRLEKERIVEVEEDARKKLARDLHDGPTQSIAAIAMRVNYIRKLIETKPQSADEELQKVEDLARRTTKEIRHMLFTLRPLVLETQGLTPALQQFAEKMKDTHDLNVVVQAQQGVDELLESYQQGVLFYIVEEAVGNARKHANAAHIWVRLYRRERFVIVEVQDDGVGFDVDATTSSYEKRGSLGMVNMRERAALAEGTLHVESAQGKGTQISVIVPVKAPSPDQPAEEAWPKPMQPAPQMPTNPH